MELKFNFSGLGKKSFYNKNKNEEHFQTFLRTIADPNIGFFRLPDNQQQIEECKAIAKKYSHIKHFVHVGIGGSSLGTETIISALQTQKAPQFHYLNNIDPDAIHDILELIEPAHTVFFFVSKSGGTAETMAGFALITTWLEQQKLGKDYWKNHFVFATDPKQSDLLTLAKEHHIAFLPIPSNIGGRFSALTPVGLFPALIAGINVDEMINGAKQIIPRLINQNLETNPLSQSAAFLMELKEAHNINQTVFMPYSSKLRELSFWYVQLWAESLGKRFNKKEKEVFEGLTPIPSYGATDQHSQMQLFMEGPRDKCLILLEVEQFKHNFSLENSFSPASLKKLAPFSLQQLMQAEFQGTKMALDEAKRFYIHIQIPAVTPESLGQLIIFLESLTALVGHYLDVDPFNQPGVEAGKRFAFEWLEKQG